MKTLAILVSALAGVLALGCEEQVVDGPPAVRYGQDECALCGMIVNEERHAAAVTLTTDDGRRDYLVFDDIGDLIDYEREHPELKIHRRYVHDLQTKAWLDTTAATIVKSPDLHTPMGSGLAAFATREAASSRGAAMTWAQAVKRRTADSIARQSQNNVASETGKACCPGSSNDSKSASNTHSGH